MIQHIQGVHTYLQQAFCNIVLLKKCAHGVEKTTFSHINSSLPKGNLSVIWSKNSKENIFGGVVRQNFLALLPLFSLSLRSAALKSLKH